MYVEAFAGYALAVSLQTVLRNLLDTCVKYLVHLIKPSNVGLVGEENAAILVVPVQETYSSLALGVIFAEASGLQSNMRNFCIVRVSAC